jgi:hypothetical protein
MKVRVLREHDNPFGDEFTKRVNCTYEHPDPAQLIASGLVEDASKPKHKAAPAPAVATAREAPAATAERPA